jgi:hypothetical protein
MRKRFYALAAISLLMVFAACGPSSGPESAAPQQQETSSSATARADCDRACLEQYIDKYMDAMLAHEVSPSLFTKDCRFTENGVQLPLGDEGLWSSMVGKGTYKFYVPDVETQQVAFIGTAREEGQDPKTSSPVALAIRLKIQDGLIS